MAKASTPEVSTRLTVTIAGTVQGVGFRPFVFGLAESLGLAGSVANTGAHVICVVEGPQQACDEFVQRVQSDAPALAEPHLVVVEASTPQGDTGFIISTSVPVDHERSSAVPPDIAACAECTCLLYTSPSPRDLSTSRMPSSA